MASPQNRQNFFMDDHEILSPTKQGIKLDMSKFNFLSFSNTPTKKNNKINEDNLNYKNINSIKQNVNFDFIEKNQIPDKNKLQKNNIIVVPDDDSLKKKKNSPKQSDKNSPKQSIKKLAEQKDKISAPRDKNNEKIKNKNDSNKKLFSLSSSSSSSSSFSDSSVSSSSTDIASVATSVQKQKGKTSSTHSSMKTNKRSKSSPPKNLEKDKIAKITKKSNNQNEINEKNKKDKKDTGDVKNKSIITNKNGVKNESVKVMENKTEGRILRNSTMSQRNVLNMTNPIPVYNADKKKATNVIVLDTTNNKTTKRKQEVSPKEMNGKKKVKYTDSSSNYNISSDESISSESEEDYVKKKIVTKQTNSPKGRSTSKTPKNETTSPKSVLKNKKRKMVSESSMDESDDKVGSTKVGSSQKETKKGGDKGGKEKEYTNVEVNKIIKSNSLSVVNDNSCEYQDGIIYESVIINKIKYTISDNVLFFYPSNKNKSLYYLKKGKITGFFKNLTNNNIDVEICIYYDEYDEIFINEVNKIKKMRRSKESFENYLDDKLKSFCLLGNIGFKIVDANLIYKKIYIYNEKSLFDENTTLTEGKDKFFCTCYIKQKEEKLCEIQDEEHWDKLVLGSSDLYYYFTNNKKSNKNKSMKLIIDKLKLNEELIGDSDKLTKSKTTTFAASSKIISQKANTTTNAKSSHMHGIDKKNKTELSLKKGSNKEETGRGGRSRSRSVTNKSGTKKKTKNSFVNDFKKLLKQDHENYYNNLLSSITDPTDRAIRMMQLDVVPKYLPCREKEIKEVHGFLESGIKQSGSNQILYISGMPGTGKTATVYSVIQLLQNKTKAKMLPPFNVFEINGMNVVHPNAAYQVLYKQLFNKKPPNALSSFKIIDRLFNKNEKDDRDVSILIIDEIDYLITKTQKVLFTLFDWPTKVNSKLVLIAISNTMDLPERLIPRCRSRLAFGRLVFSPYKGDEIEKIIKERLENCKEIIDNTAIQLCARKVANVSGDIRKALQICRKAFENKRGNKIIPKDIIEATNQLFDSPLTQAINYLPWAFKIFLTCVIIELRMLNEFIIPYKKVLNRYQVMIETSGKFIGMCSDIELFKIMIDKLVKMGILLIRPYIPLENLSKNRSKEDTLGFNDLPNKGGAGENQKGATRTQVSADIDKESGDMGLELNVEHQLIITALMKDADCCQKLNFY
ncbi:origin recognition complex subunit 1 [Hepatocystis sp. ex Piliocolobus tephrosceles]|nr:origin recognition complex subunit 1 [Hepatocystis sp. ex Piliocolobus tephrosceles]